MRVHISFVAAAISIMGFSAAAEGASEAQLERLLEAKDWKTLQDAVTPFKAPEAARADLAWLRKKVEAGEGGFTLAGFYTMDLAIGMMNLDPQGFIASIGAKDKPEDPDKNLQVAGAMYGVYTGALMIVDGAACSRTDPIHYWLNHRYGPANIDEQFDFLKHFSAAGKAAIVDRVVALEVKTAGLRGNDETLCKGGVEDPPTAGTAFEAAIIAGQQRSSAAPIAGSDIFLPPDEAAKARERARAHLRETLTKLLQ